MRRRRTTPEEAFEALLEGRAGDPEATRLAKLAGALRPSRLAEPDPRFRARVRSELLAAASATEQAEVDAFAAVLDDPRAVVPAAMRPLVAVAAALEPAARPLPAPAFRYGLRERLIARGARPPSLAGRVAEQLGVVNERMRRSLRVVSATGLVAALLAGSSATIAAAAHALPVDDLYPVKIAKERFELAFRSGADKGFVYLDHARERLFEARGMAARPVLEPAPYDRTFGRMDEQTVIGETIILDEFKRRRAPRAAVERVSAFALTQLQDLIALRDRIPAGALPSWRDSLTVAGEVAKRAQLVLSGCPCPSNALVNPPTTIGPAPEASFGCACGQTFTGGEGGSGSQGEPPPQFGPPPPPPDGEPPPDDDRFDLPDVPGTDVDDTAEDLINDLLNQLPLPSIAPTPEATVPPAAVVPLPTSLSTGL